MKPSQFDRLAVKRKILEASDEGKIPTLSYIHFEVLDPDPLDSMLIEALDNDTLAGGLTNQLFFDLLAETPDYLAFEPFRNRLKEWQETLHDPSSSEDGRIQAKENLESIGKVLAKKPQGRPAHNLPPGFLLRLELDKMKASLTPFLAETKALTPMEKAAAFKNKFPLWAEYSGLLKKHRAPLELAKAIICKKHEISKRLLLYHLAQ